MCQPRWTDRPMYSCDRPSSSRYASSATWRFARSQRGISFETTGSSAGSQPRWSRSRARTGALAGAGPRHPGSDDAEAERPGSALDAEGRPDARAHARPRCHRAARLRGGGAGARCRWGDREALRARGPCGARRYAGRCEVSRLRAPSGLAAAMGLAAAAVAAALVTLFALLLVAILSYRDASTTARHAQQAIAGADQLATPALHLHTGPRR